MYAGSSADGTDSFAEPIAPADAWPLQVVVAITSSREKSVGSGKGMKLSAESSPYYQAWVDSHPMDLDVARSAIANRDFARLAEISESSCLKMHAAAMCTQPPLLYWNGTTIDCLHRITELRAAGLPVFFTVDAGPQVKAVCMPESVDELRSELAAIPGVADLIVTGLGPGLESF